MQILIEEQLNSLPSRKPHELRELWQKVFEKAPHPKMRKSLMIKFLAYRLQELEYGGLSPRTKDRLRALARQFEANPNFEPSGLPRIRPGTRLVRQWKSQVHVVTVENENYEYRGARYESLSEIARLITGTRWSGPLFFGLKPKLRASVRTP